MGNGLMQISAFDKLLSIGDYEEAYDNGDLQYISYLNTGKLNAINTNIFYGTGWSMPNLQKIDMPNVKIINVAIFGISGSPVFNISVPNLEYLSGSGFYNCYNISKIVLSNVKSVNGMPFFSCSSLKEIYLNNCISVGISAFQGMSNLEYVNLDKCEYLGDNAFGAVESTLYKFSSINLYNIKYLGYNALPRGFTYAKLGFSYVTANENMYEQFTGATDSKCIIDFCYAKTINTIPHIYFTSASQSSIGSIVIKASKATNIDSSAFYYIKNRLNEVYMNNVTSIGSYTFSLCSRLSHVELNSLKIVPEGLFYGCHSIEQLKLNNVISVDIKAFYNIYNNDGLSRCLELPRCSIFNATYISSEYATDLDAFYSIRLPKVSIISIYLGNFYVQLPRNLFLDNCKIMHVNANGSNSFDADINIESIYMPNCSYISYISTASYSIPPRAIEIRPYRFSDSEYLSISFLSFKISAPKIKNFGPVMLHQPDNLNFPLCENGYFAVRPDTPNVNINNLKSGFLYILHDIRDYSSYSYGKTNPYFKQLILSNTTSNFELHTEPIFSFDYISINNAKFVTLQNAYYYSNYTYGSVNINDYDANAQINIYHVSTVNINFPYFYYGNEGASIFHNQRLGTSNVDTVNLPYCSYIYTNTLVTYSMLYYIKCNSLNMPELKSVTYLNGPSYSYGSVIDIIYASTLFAPQWSYLSLPTDRDIKHLAGIGMHNVQSLTIGLSSFAYLISFSSIKYLSMSNIINFKIPAYGQYSDKALPYSLPLKVEQLHLENCQYIATNTTGTGRYVFSLLTYLDLPNLISIESAMVMSIPNLSYFNAPKLEYLGAYAFSKCKYLSYLDLPKCSFIGAYALPSTIELVRFGYSGIVSLGHVDMNSSYTHIIQVPESLYSAYMSDSRYISLMSQGNWLITAY